MVCPFIVHVGVIEMGHYKPFEKALKDDATFISFPPKFLCICKLNFGSIVITKWFDYSSYKENKSVHLGIIEA